MNDNDKLFTKECSLRTVQADQNGFFQNFYCAVVDSFKSHFDWEKWLKNIFGEQKTDRLKFQLLFQDPSVSWIVLGYLENVSEVYRKKDAKLSIKKRKEVEDLVNQLKCGDKTVDLNKALIIASQAVLFAPYKGENRDSDESLSLSRALSNRSDIFLALNDHFNGLNDLRLSVKNGLPVKKNPEYHAKLAKLYALRGDKIKCKDSINTHHQMVGNKKQQKIILNNEIQKIKKRVQSLKIRNEKNELKLKPPLKELLTGLELAESSQVGKHFVAERDLKVGEILLVEKAKCACLYPKNFGTHCHQCFCRLVAPIGCTECATVAFCSEACCKIALGSYHKYECKYLELLIGSGMSVLCHIALRLVLQCETPEIALEVGKRTSQILCTNSAKRTPDDFFIRCLMSTFLLRCLQKSGFFGTRSTDSTEPTETEVEVGSLMLGYLQSLQFNAHEIYEKVWKDQESFLNSRFNFIGVGIYEAGAMFNHECYPSVTRYFHYTDLVLTSIRCHSKGEKVAENYGPIFTKQSIKGRQRDLSSRYRFDCECRACKEHWPMLEKLDNKCRMRCQTKNCRGIFKHPNDPLKTEKCELCKHTQTFQQPFDSLNKAQELMKQGTLKLNSGNIDEAVEHIKTGIEIFQQIALPPHKDLHVVQATLNACLAVNGNIFNIRT